MSYNDFFFFNFETWVRLGNEVPESAMFSCMYISSCSRRLLIIPLRYVYLHIILFLYGIFTFIIVFVFKVRE